MMMKYLIALCTAAMLVGPVSAQKIEVTAGNLNQFADQKAVSIEFTYDNMIVGDDKTEATYVAEKTKGYNEKEQGKGDTWAKAWVNDRKERFEPQFIELYTKFGAMEVNKQPSTYTMIVNTTRTEPGWNVGVMRKNAYIDIEIKIVETADKTKVLSKVTVKNSPGRGGMGYDFDTGFRLQEAYAKAAKEFGQYLEKLKKKKK